MRTTEFTAGLVDVGVNLTQRSFGHDFADVMARARQAGVAQMVVTGTDVSESGRAARLARHHPGVLFSTAGVHPHHAAPSPNMTGNEVNDIATAPCVIEGQGDGALKIFFEASASREAYLAFVAESGERDVVEAYNAVADNETTGTIN